MPSAQTCEMRMVLWLSLLATGAAASASQPTGKNFGPWQIISIASLSGTGDDASVILVQGEEPDILQARWDQGGSVVVSINVENCSGSDNFERSYSVKPSRWLQFSRRAIQRKLRAGWSAWLAQAKLLCGSTPAIKAFKIDDIEGAAFEFTRRLRYFGATPNAPPAAR